MQIQFESQGHLSFIPSGALALETQGLIFSNTNHVLESGSCKYKYKQYEHETFLLITIEGHRGPVQDN